MLVLSRKTGEKICIGDGIIVTVLGWQGNRVRLGIDAPPHVRIVREELMSKGWGDEARDPDEPVLARHAGADLLTSR